MSKKNLPLLLLSALVLTQMVPVVFAEDLPPALGESDSTSAEASTTTTTSDSTDGEDAAASTTSTDDTSSTTDSDSVTATETAAITTRAFEDFTDVPVDYPYYNAIIVLRYQGLLKGYDDNTFRPEQPLNRVEALKLVFEVADIKLNAGIAPATFSDTEQTGWYSGYLNKAVFMEVVSGYADGTFKPAQSVNLVEFLKMLFLAQGEDLSKTNLNQIPYADIMPGQWYSKYVNFVKINDLIKTSEDNKIFPGEPLTRARAADIIYRYRNFKAKQTEQNAVDAADDQEVSSSTGAASTIIPVKDFALYVSASYKFAVQYPKVWFYSAFVDKPDAQDIAVYGFGPDELTANAPLVTLELLPDNAAFTTNLIDETFSYLRDEGESGQIKLSAKINGSTRIYRLAGPVAQEANMLSMLKSLTVDIEGLESFNPAEAATTETTDEAATDDAADAATTDTTTDETP